MSLALVGFGANLGNPFASYQAAQQQLRAHPAIRALRASPLYRTAPVGGPIGQPDFLNGALVIETDLAPAELLQTLQETENALGRERSVHWGPRTIDLDLLLAGDRVVMEPDLVVPHPRLHFRRFVLAPACAVCPKIVHPLIRRSMAELLQSLSECRMIFVAGGSSELSAEVRRRSREHGIQSVAAIPRAAMSTYHQSGPFVVAAAVEEAPQTDWSTTWIVLLADPVQCRAERHVLPLLPVVDCRAKSDSERLERVTVFLESATGAVVPA